MPDKPTTAADLIGIGERLHILRWPADQHVDIYQKTLTEFPDRLESAGFPKARNAMQGFQVDQLRYYLANGQLDGQQSLVLKAAADIVAKVLIDEAQQKPMIVSNTDLPGCLLSLERDTSLTPEQKVYRSDVEACLRARQYRPAIVMAWALCYDRVRRWVYDDAARLGDFNALLANRKSKRSGSAFQVVDYKDFYRLGEAEVLAVCRDSQNALTVFNQRHHRDLQGYLDSRNDMAHANDKTASAAQAKAYVENVITAMTSAPFV